MGICTRSLGNSGWFIVRFYGSARIKRTYADLCEAYRKAGVDEKEIARLVTLDVKPDSYFSAKGVKNQHGGGTRLFAHDEEIMRWLFGRRK